MVSQIRSSDYISNYWFHNFHNTSRDEVSPKLTLQRAPLCIDGCTNGTHPITRNRIGPPMIRCRGHTYRLVIEALV